MRAPTWRFGSLTLLCLGVAAYALWAYGSGIQRVPVHPEMQAVFNAHRGLITVHAVGASLALLLGPWQFLDRARARFPRAHRIAGYAYLTLGVGVGGGAGVLLAPHAFGGLVSRLGFGLLGCLWLGTGGLAIAAARRRRWDEHRRWMMRNFALALGAVTLRLYLPAAVAAGLPFESAYPVIAWLCWVPNLLVVEWRLRDRAVLRSTAV
jgi:hypothetical protein